MNKTAIELFAGVGGFRVGLNNITGFDEETGRANENGPWKFVWANQWEPAEKAQSAYKCYAKRFGEEDATNIDISTVNKKEIPNHTLLTGGFPCQDYSVAHPKSNEKGIEGCNYYNDSYVLFPDTIKCRGYKSRVFYAS